MKTIKIKNFYNQYQNKITKKYGYVIGDYNPAIKLN